MYQVAMSLFILSAAFLLVQLYLTNRILAPAIGGTYTEGLIGSPQFINPLFASSNDADRDISRLVYSGLMQQHPNEGLITDLASSYNISEDELVYTFTLRDNALWHDGTPVTTRDIIFTFTAIQSPEYKSPLGSAFQGVAIEQVNDNTVAFTLDEPFAPFLSSLTVGIMPADYWGDLDPATMRLAERNLVPIGSGPFKFLEFAKDKKGVIQTYSLERNAKYYGDAPYIEQIDFKFYPDAEGALDALMNRRIEGVAIAPINELENLSDEGHLKIVTPYLPQITTLFFNLENDKVENSKLRDALGNAIDKEALIEEVLMDRGRVMHGAILPQTGNESTAENPSPYDADRTRAILGELGYTIKGEDVFATKGEDETLEKIELTITTIDSPETVAVAEFIKNSWIEVGIDAQVNAVHPSSFRDEVLKERSYDILLSGTLYGGDVDPYPFWHSSQAKHPGLNLSQYTNRIVDDMIADARKISDEDEREQKYAELVTTINEDFPAVFLYQPTYNYVTADKIHGQDISSIIIPADRFGQVSMWYVKTRKRFSFTK